MTEGKPRLALHVCCGPCATVCLERLTPRFEVVPIWFNPNLYPAEEHGRRLDAAVSACDAFGLTLVVLAADHDAWLAAVRGMEGEAEGGRRCDRCIALRLGRAADVAERMGCAVVTTTLTVGPQKDAETIHELGQNLTEKVALRWLDETFRKEAGYQRSVELSKELGLYRQRYCGCEFSLPAEER